MMAETLADDYQVYLEPAEKHEKNDNIEVMNNDFDCGRIHIRRGSMLSDELDRARWDLRKLDKNKKVEDASIPNDVSDAGLYSHRWCRHRKPVAITTQLRVLSPEWVREQARLMLVARQDEARRIHESEAATKVGSHFASLDAAFGVSFDKEWWHEPQ